MQFVRVGLYVMFSILEFVKDGQLLGLDNLCPTMRKPVNLAYSFINFFCCVQKLVSKRKLIAGYFPSSFSMFFSAIFLVNVGWGRMTSDNLISCLLFLVV